MWPGDLGRFTSHAVTHARLMIDGKFYGASKEKGRIDIPFAKSAHSTQIILIRDQFAEI